MLLTLLTSLMTPLAFAAEPTTRPVILIELFTSEGCSSCPPADALLAKLDNPDAIEGVEIIPLALHVDYWDDLGWTDPYSSVDFTKRQRDYATAMRERQVYTPQMIVAGRAPLVGSEEETARREIAAAAKHPCDASIDLRASRGEGRLHVALAIAHLPARKEAADVILAITEDELKSNVARGENAGRTLDHTAVVRSLQSVGAIDPARDAFMRDLDVKVDPAWRMEKLHVVAFVQESKLGLILVARSIPAIR
jgi:hypothetical protein